MEQLQVTSVKRLVNLPDKAVTTASKDFKYVVEYITENMTMKARFTSDKHAKRFFRTQKKNNVRGVKFFEITKKGTLKEVKMR